MIGVMWGLLVCRMRFGVIMTGIGVISLAGVVVNNAHRADRLHRSSAARKGWTPIEAIVTGGPAAPAAGAADGRSRPCWA